MAYAVDDSASLANTASAVGLPSRSCCELVGVERVAEQLRASAGTGGTPRSRSVGSGGNGRSASESRMSVDVMCRVNPGFPQDPVKTARTAEKDRVKISAVARIPSSGSAPALGALLGVAGHRGDRPGPPPGPRPAHLGHRRAHPRGRGGGRGDRRRARPRRSSPRSRRPITLNVAFIRPYGGLDIASVDDGTELVAFVIVALLVGQLVTRLVHRRTQVAEASEQVRALDQRVAQLHDERSHLARRATRAEELEALDIQRSALLRSVSHDLRTPLASIRAVATDLRDGVEYDDVTRDELLTTVCDEVDRLDRFVANLLSLSRIEAGAFTPGTPGRRRDRAGGRPRPQPRHRSCAT